MLRLVGADEVRAQNLVDGVQPRLDRGRVVGRAVLPQEELQHVDRNVGADLDLADEILAHDPSGKRLVGLAIEGVGREVEIGHHGPPGGVGGYTSPTAPRLSAKNWRALQRRRYDE